MNDVDLETVWGLPCPTRAWPMLVTPGFTAHFLDGPTGRNVPARVYEGYTEFRWLPQFTPQLRADVAVTPGYFGDFETTSRKAIRLHGYGTGIWTFSPQLKMVLGAAYSDRLKNTILPVAGVVWKPSDDWNLNLVFPAPKIARRVWADVPCLREHRGLAVPGRRVRRRHVGRHGRSPGTNDVLRYTDWRIYAGWEHKILFGMTLQVEVGYVFSRQLQYDSDATAFTPGNTVMLRGTLRY